MIHAFAALATLFFANPVISAELEPGVWRGTVNFAGTIAPDPPPGAKAWRVRKGSSALTSNVTIQIGSDTPQLIRLPPRVPRIGFVIIVGLNIGVPILRIEQISDGTIDIDAGGPWDYLALRNLKLADDSLSGEATYSTDDGSRMPRKGPISLRREL